MLAARGRQTSRPVANAGLVGGHAACGNTAAIIWNAALIEAALWRPQGDVGARSPVCLMRMNSQDRGLQQPYLGAAAHVVLEAVEITRLEHGAEQVSAVPVAVLLALWYMRSGHILHS